MKRKVLHHPPKGILDKHTLAVSDVICGPKMRLLPMSQFHHGWLHAQTSQGAQGAVASQLPP